MRICVHLWLIPVFCLVGCATIRVTDPNQTATHQFLMSVAASRAIGQLSFEPLRDRKVYLDSTFLTAATQPATEHSFLLGELRARILMSGVRLVSTREEAQIVMEVRSGGLSIDRYEYLLGIPSLYLTGGSGNSSVGGVPVLTPEISLYKNTRQKGYGSVAYIAYWRDTGEVVASSGPFVGRTVREDIWILGYGPSTTGTIPPAEK